jgi:hypothetical protein
LGSATIVLIGGCAWQADQDPAQGGSGAVIDTPQTSATGRLRRITDVEYASIVRDVLQVTLAGADAVITSTGAYPSAANAEANFTELLASSYQAAAQNVAKQAIDPAKMQMLLGNVASTPATDEQLTAFLDTKVASLWHRPVAANEASVLKSIYRSGADGPSRGFDLLLQAVLQAPSFLFRAEP